MLGARLELDLIGREHTIQVSTRELVLVVYLAAPSDTFSSLFFVYLWPRYERRRGSLTKCRG